MAHGLSDQALHHDFLIGRSTITKFIPEVLDAIVQTMGPVHLKLPTSQAEWNAIADGFENRWNFPHVLGSLDGKHIDLIKPRKSGSVYFNYKQRFSIALFALVGPDYRFLYTDIGAAGRNSDGGIWRNSKLRKCLYDSRLRNKIGIPAAKRLKKAARIHRKDIPYFVLADDAFTLSEVLLKPFKPTPSKPLRPHQQIFNERLSRARQTVECAFGQLANRWRILISRAYMMPERARKMVTACVILHNFIMAERGSVLETLQLDVPNEDTKMTLRKCKIAKRRSLRENQVKRDRRGRTIAPTIGESLRHYFEEFFTCDDPLPWLNDNL